MSSHKIIVAGGRYYNNYDYLKNKLLVYINNLSFSKFFYNYTIISGGAKGADTLALRFAKEYNTKYKEFPADWEKYGRSAGPIRNEQMAKYVSGPDNMCGNCLMAFWDYESKGTKNMIQTAVKYKLDTILIYKI